MRVENEPPEQRLPVGGIFADGERKFAESFVRRRDAESKRGREADRASKSAELTIWSRGVDEPYPLLVRTSHILRNASRS